MVSLSSRIRSQAGTAIQKGGGGYCRVQIGGVLHCFSDKLYRLGLLLNIIPPPFSERFVCLFQ